MVMGISQSMRMPHLTSLLEIVMLSLLLLGKTERHSIQPNASVASLINRQTGKTPYTPFPLPMKTLIYFKKSLKTGKKPQLETVNCLKQGLKRSLQSI
jgi:hypothetical protein